MIHCANEQNAELVIVTRDSDYGVTFENKSYINDHLKQEFSERVSKKRKILLYSKLSDALKHFKVPVTAQEEALEAEIVKSSESISIAKTEHRLNSDFYQDLILLGFPPEEAEQIARSIS